MWIQLEGAEDPVELFADITRFIVKLSHVLNKEECIIPHSSGSFNLLQKEAKALSDGVECDLGDLKVRIKNRKANSEWKLDEVLRNIYHYKSGILDAELKDKKNVFEKVNVNEATTREFISVILVNAVNHVKENNDATAKLMVEVNIKGSHGYSPLDYAVLLCKHFILIMEAKPLEAEKGIAQNLAQMHSAAEMLKKRKIDQTDFETMPIIGVVTTGMAWLFIRYIGPIESAQLEISNEFYCSFMGNMEDVRRVASYVVRLLQSQEKISSKCICNVQNLLR
ncbi:23737_t:CDS:2 [Dentiscutata erythropus]|uniref:23737_t:CDS:1 n=1 Tax=Dentiscutata erythropus TaxID=1348616 RepID=A0A9N9E6L3_9GLOM|nr:23737_t:CDS:2 [Dentiscutata erythropus]